jgi:hypothetical protein
MNHKQSTKYSGNASGKVAKENYGRGPTKAGTTGDQAGPSTANGKGRFPTTREWNPSKEQNYKGNPNSIQERQTYNNVGNKD